MKMTMTPVASRPHAGQVTEDPDPEVPERTRRRYSAGYKQRILTEHESLDRAGKCALLRREGLYTSLISAWREQRDQGAPAGLGKPAGRRPADLVERENARLRRENERLAAQWGRRENSPVVPSGASRPGAWRRSVKGQFVLALSRSR